MSEPTVVIAYVRTLWQIGYERTDGRGRGRVVSTRLYPYRTAQRLVARLRRLGNDAYIAGALRVRTQKEARVS